MPRSARRRGRAVHIKGLSSEQVCILSAVSTDRIAISGAAKPGKVSSCCVNKFLSDRLSQRTVLCTDNEKAYPAFGKNAGVTLIQMETDRRVCGYCGIQRINAYHSLLKEFLRHFHGVSTKYLSHYLLWNDRMFCSARQESEQESLLFSAMLTESYCLRCRDIPHRPAIPSAYDAVQEVTA